MLSALPHNLVSRIGHCLCSERGFVGPAILKLRDLEKKNINKNFFFFCFKASNCNNDFFVSSFT